MKCVLRVVRLHIFEPQQGAGQRGTAVYIRVLEQLNSVTRMDLANGSLEESLDFRPCVQVVCDGNTFRGVRRGFLGEVQAEIRE